jgi:hypothetical protein
MSVSVDVVFVFVVLLVVFLLPLCILNGKTYLPKVLELACLRKGDPRCLRGAKEDVEEKAVSNLQL